MSIKQAIEALESCTPGDYSTGHVIYPSYDEDKVNAALAALRSMPAEPVAWHNPVATAVRDSMTGQVQLEYIGHFPADELVRLYAAPQPHHIDLVNVAVAVRDACHKAWVTSAENWRADVDVRQIVRDTATPHTAPEQLTDEQIIEWVTSGEYNVVTNDWASHIEFARAIERAVLGGKP